ncbi:Ubiquitin fusion degradation protein 4 [Entomophthora muscae]|uniref:Ubiquitin fusion degradation protein 4 n=1 Tax=Entomophthora muscae TaxID=34485 RepID=A0ACC2UDB2_9FUNG|nr:Ubiquitin fusion degradation protein 4 [Entomophthora muscae]
MIQSTVLQSLSVSLSVASEESFASFSKVHNLVATLVKIMNGTFGPLDDETFISLLTSGVLDDFNDNMILCCRCLCNLIEANPSSLDVVVSSGAVKTIIPYLRHLRCVELGEQIIQLLLLISRESPATVARERGLSALVQFLDFFSTQVQRTAILAAANCCRALLLTQIADARESLEVISRTLKSTDSVIVEYSCLLLKHLVERFQNHPVTLEHLFSESFVGEMLSLLEPGLSTQPEPKIYSSLIVLVSSLAKTSSAVASILLQPRMLPILKYNISNECSLPNSSSHLEKSLELSYSLLPKISSERRATKLKIDAALYLQFAQLMAPAALNLFKGSASNVIKLHSLTLLFKIVLFTPPEANVVLETLPLASFLSGLTVGSPGSLFSIRALQILYMLLERIPSLYQNVLMREGVAESIEATCSAQSPESAPLATDPWALFEHIESIHIPNSVVALTSDASELQKTYAALSQLMHRQIVELKLKCDPSKDSRASEKLHSVFQVLNLKQFGANKDKFRENLIKLRDLLHDNDMTTHELASINFATRLYSFLIPREHSTSSRTCQDMFFNIFLKEDGLQATQNLVQHLHNRLEQTETYQLLLLSQDSSQRRDPRLATLRPLLQTCRLHLTPAKGLSLSSIEMVVQLSAPFELVVQNFRSMMQGEAGSAEMQFKYSGKRLKESETVLKALMLAGFTLDLLKADPITITYLKASKSEALVRKSVSSRKEKLEEHEVILCVLRVLHLMATKWVTKDQWRLVSPRIPHEPFTNAKLTGKLNRQLQEISLVVSQCLPSWCDHLVSNFPFLFPFATRMDYLQATAFGSDRLIAKHMSVEIRPGEGAESFGRMSKLKIQVPRGSILEAAKRIARLYSKDRSVLEIQFRDEVGSGQGPTLEFFSCVFQEFCKKAHGLWRESQASDSEFVNIHHGLFPACLPSHASHIQNKSLLFKTLGWIAAKSLIDARVTDLPLSEAFLELLMNKTCDIPQTNLNTLKLVRSFDPTFADSLFNINEMASNDADSIASLGLTFVFPGTNNELMENGTNIIVSKKNVDKFIKDTLELLTNSGIRYALSSFEEGFNDVFPLQKLGIFTPRELTTIFGSGEEDWSAEVIHSAIKAEHGYTSESLTVIRLVTIISRFEIEQRRSFLQFITGSRKLPIGGFRALNPNLTIVRKICDATCVPDNYLPSVNTCFNYLKLPDYSSEEVMKNNLLKAMEEGKMSFHLS